MNGKQDHFFHLRTPASAINQPGLRQIWAAYLELDRTQWLKPAQIEQTQLNHVRKLLSHCYENVPYYRRVLGEIGYPARPIVSLDDFRRVPLLTRDLYQRNFDDLQAKSLPADLKALEGGYTSGTNGVQIKVPKTNRDAMVWNALYLRDLQWCNIDPRGRLAGIRLLGLTPEKLEAAMRGASIPFWNKTLDALIEMGPSFGMEIRQDPRRQLEWLAQVRPDYLLSMPTNLELLAGLMLESGQRLGGLRAIQSLGETLSEPARQRIEAGFGVPVKNLYSTTEGGYIASPCPAGHGLHVHSENVLAEVLDENNQPCRPGQTGRLVFTSLHNYLAPFIRYDILDEVTLAPAPCPCGRGLPLWSHIEGRRFPLFHLPDGRRKASIGVVRDIRLCGGIHQFQVIQKSSDYVNIRVVPDRTWSDENAQHMRKVIQDVFESPIRVDIEPMQFIPRPAGGKLKLIVVELE